MSEYEQLQSGLVTPKQKPKPDETQEAKKMEPVETLAKSPFGYNPDGSFTLTEEVMVTVRQHMLNRCRQNRLPDEPEFIDVFADAVWLYRGICFEQYI